MSQGSHCPDVARAAAKFLSRNFVNSEIVLISGDLASTGLSIDLKQASRYLNATSGKTAQYLSAQDLPTLGFRKKKALMPGNHDRFRDHACNANGTEFDAEFSDQWGNDPDRVRCATITHKTTKKNLHLVMGDFCLRRNSDAFPYLANSPLAAMRCGQGTVYSNTLQAMIEKTAALRAASAENGIVWVSHFPPTGALAGLLPSLTLQGWPSLIEAAKNSGIKYIISGHIHEAARFEEDGVQIICAGALCTFFETGGNWIHRIEFELNNGDVILLDIINYKYDLDRGSFIQVRKAA